MFISLYTTRLILNSLGASDFGIFNIVGGAIAMLGFLNGAMASATQRFMSYSEGEGDKEKQKSIFNVSIILHFAISLLVGIVLLLAGYFFFNGILNIPDGRIDAAKVVYVSLIVSTMFTVMTVPYDAAMNAHENMKYYAAVGILESLLKLAVAFACVFTAKDKLIVYGLLMACIPLITLTIMRIYCHRHYEECTFNVKRYWDKSLMREMTGFAGWNFLVSAAGVLSQYGLGIIVNSFFGVLLNAAQGIANQISGVLMTFSQNALKAINPIIVKSEGAGEKTKFVYVSLLGCRISFFIFGFFSIPFILKMDVILQLWLKEVPQWAVLFCQLQLLRILIELLTLSLGSAINAYGNIKFYTIIKSLIYFMPLVLVPVLFYFGFQPYWLYIIWILCWSVFGGLISIFFCRNLIGITFRFYFKQVFIPCFCVSVLSFAVYWLVYFMIKGDNIFFQIAPVFIEIISYSLLGWFFILQRSERVTMKNLIVRLFNFK